MTAGMRLAAGLMGAVLLVVPTADGEETIDQHSPDKNFALRTIDRADGSAVELIALPSRKNVLGLDQFAHRGCAPKWAPDSRRLAA